MVWSAMAPAFLGMAMMPTEGDEAMPAAAARSPELGDLLTSVERRVDHLAARTVSLEGFYFDEVEPLVRRLVRMRDDPDHALRIARALVREGSREGIPPRLLLAVMSVENPWLELDARSPAGAVGLMQVMPFHAGSWGCGSDDLTDLDANICHGTKILAQALEREDGDLERALLRYNGCVRGTNTPDCHLYPTWVRRYVGGDWPEGWDRGRWGMGQQLAALPLTSSTEALP